MRVGFGGGGLKGVEAPSVGGGNCCRIPDGGTAGDEDRAEPLAVGVGIAAGTV